MKIQLTAVSGLLLIAMSFTSARPPLPNETPDNRFRNALRLVQQSDAGEHLAL